MFVSSFINQILVGDYIDTSDISGPTWGSFGWACGYLSNFRRPFKCQRLEALFALFWSDDLLFSKAVGWSAT